VFDASTLSYSVIGTGRISGGTSVVKSGAGTLTISTTNDYTGGTIINGGVLSIGANINLGANAGLLTINKTGTPQAVLRATATFSLATNRPLKIDSGGGAIEVQSGNTLTLAPLSTTAVTFNGPLAVQGNGALTVNLSGAPIIGPGASLSIAGTSTLNVGGTADPFSNGSTHMDVANSGALNITSGSKTIAALSGTGGTTLSAGTQLTATSVLQNTLTLGSGATLTIAAIPGGPLAGMGPISPVPEPSTWAMLVLAAMGLSIYRRRR
jgi:fibronectin-binding autotransporter adhesin